jgi:hypothetical protein
VRTLYRYITRELVGPFTLGAAVFTFLLVLQLLYRLARLIIVNDVPAAQVGLLLLRNLPNILVLTQPRAGEAWAAKESVQTTTWVSSILVNTSGSERQRPLSPLATLKVAPVSV